MFRKFALLTLCLWSFAAHSELVDSRSFQYPINDPLRATLSSQLDRQANPNFKVGALISVPGRESIPLFEGRSGVPYAAAIQSRRAPLVFVIPGLGGTAVDGTVMALGEVLRKQGFNVVLLSNPFSWQFALGGSKSAIPGYLPRDSADLYQFMKKLMVQLHAEKNFEVTSYGVAGYSLGGALIPFLLKEDQAERQFNFTRSLSINPPISMSRGMDVLDQFEGIGSRWAGKDRDLIMGQLLSKAETLLSAKVRGPAFYAQVNEVQMADDQLKWIIGDQFRLSLADIIFASQQVHDQGILKTPATKSRRSVRYSEALAFSFASYRRVFVAPSLRSEGIRGDDMSLTENTDMHSVAELLHHNSGAYVIHNADDFLFSESRDLAWVQSTYGDRWVVYPKGGHIGNLWYAPVQKRINEIFSGM